MSSAVKSRSWGRTKRPKVLVVDDEDNIVLAMQRVLYQDNERYSVLLAPSAEIAGQIIRELPIDLLVTDVRLPGKSGMDLLRWVAQKAPLTRTIIMTAFESSAWQSQALALGCVRIFRKPVELQELRAAIVRALDRRDSLTGDLSDLSVIDVIQMLCIAKKTTAVRLFDGTMSGVILIDNGEIINAVWNDLTGQDAVFRMMAVTSGIFHTFPLPADIERTIQRDWQNLLIEGLRKLDDDALARESGDAPPRSLRLAPMSLPPPPPGPEIIVPPLSMVTRTASASSRPNASNRDSSPDADSPPSMARPEVSRLIDTGFEKLRAGKPEEARLAWEEALRLDPGNRGVESNLKKISAKKPY